MAPNPIAALFVVVWLLIALAIYFLPTLIGHQRKMAVRGTLLLVNLLLGWTLVGWFVCLIWAALGQTDDQVAFYRGSRAGDARKEPRLS